MLTSNLLASLSEQTSGTGVVGPSEGEVVHEPRNRFIVGRSLDTKTAQRLHGRVKVDLLELAIVGQEAGKDGHSLMECCHLGLGLLLIDEACDLELAWMGRMIVASEISVVSIEPECA